MGSGSLKDIAGSKKAPIGYVPPILLIAAAEPLEEGAQKYGAYNWRSTKISLVKHLEAVIRHTLAFMDGEDCAQDSGIDHLDHAVAGLAVIIDARACGTLIDDRTPGPAGHTLDMIHTRRSKVPAPEDKLPLETDKDCGLSYM